MTKATIQLQKKKQTGPTKDGKTSDPTNEDHKVSSRCGECKKTSVQQLQSETGGLSQLCVCTVCKGEKAKKNERAIVCIIVVLKILQK